MINHNYGRYLGGAIESVLEQEVPAAEIIVVDDGSTDESRAVLAEYDGRVRGILTSNRGKGSATNTAVRSCTGEVVVLLDSDDLMLPQRLRRLSDTYARHPDAQWVWHGLRHVERDSLVERPSAPLKNFTDGFHDHRDAVLRGRLPITTPATSALSWRRTFLERLLPLPEAVRSQDNYLKFLTLGLAPGVVIAEAMAIQGIHESNAYTSAIGAERRRKQVVRALDLAPGLRDHRLMALHHRTVSEVLIDSRFTSQFSPEDRAKALLELRAAGPRVIPWFAVTAARRGRNLLRGAARARYAQS